MMKKTNLSHTCANRKDVGLYITRTHPYLQTIKVSSLPKAVCCWYMYLSNLPQRGYFNKLLSITIIKIVKYDV